MEDVNRAEFKCRFTDRGDTAHAETLVVGDPHCLFNYFGIADDQGAAVFIQSWPRERLDGNLRPVSGRVAHGDAKDGTIAHDVPPISCHFLRFPPTPP